MTDKNRYGLSRDIPADVQRAVRQRCAFGCVICGLAIYQYEHVDPVFSQAREHDPSAIVLLCGSCHDRVTRGQLSKESVRLAAENPRARERGFSFGPFDVGTEHPEIRIGPLVVTEVASIVRVFGVSLLAVKPPEANGAPFRLNALLTDQSGRVVVSVIDNEWRAETSNWDVEVIGQRISFRRAPGDICLRVRTEPPGRLVIEAMKLNFAGTQIHAGENAFAIRLPTGGTFTAYSARVWKCDAAIDISATGMAIGVGCGSGGVEIGNATFQR